MAVFNEILVGRFNRALQKLTGIKGGPPVKQLATELMPVHMFNSGVENRVFEAWNMHSFTITFSASAANLNSVQLRNPVGSNVVVVFVKVACSGTTGGQSYILSSGPKTTDQGTIVPLPANTNFDRRSGTGQRSMLIASDSQIAGPIVPAPDRAVAIIVANQTYDFIVDVCEEFPLLPGDAMAIRTGTVNTADNISFWWRERPLEESEVS
jgi:hypothetical protein